MVSELGYYAGDSNFSDSCVPFPLIVTTELPLPITTSFDVHSSEGNVEHRAIIFWLLPTHFLRYLGSERSRKSEPGNLVAHLQTCTQSAQCVLCRPCHVTRLSGFPISCLTINPSLQPALLPLHAKVKDENEVEEMSGFHRFLSGCTVVILRFHMVLKKRSLHDHSIFG